MGQVSPALASLVCAVALAALVPVAVAYAAKALWSWYVSTPLNADPRQALYEAASKGSAALRKELTTTGSKINVTDSSGATALHLAVSEKKEAAVMALVRAGVDINATWDERTALHLAVPGGNVNVINALIQGGANLEAPVAGSRGKGKGKGMRALHLAAYMGKVVAVNALLDAGAALEANTEDGDTPLHAAARGGKIETAQALLDKGANVQAQNSFGKTPLMVAREEKHSEMADFLSAS